MKIKVTLSRILGDKRISISSLSKSTGISRSTLTKLYYGEGHAISYSVLEKLCDALSCNVEDILTIGGENNV